MNGSAGDQFIFAHARRKLAKFRMNRIAMSQPVAQTPNARTGSRASRIARGSQTRWVKLNGCKPS